MLDQVSFNDEEGQMQGSYYILGIYIALGYMYHRLRNTTGDKFNHRSLVLYALGGERREERPGADNVTLRTIPPLRDLDA